MPSKPTGSGGARGDPRGVRRRSHEPPASEGAAAPLRRGPESRQSVLRLVTRRQELLAAELDAHIAVSARRLRPAGSRRYRSSPRGFQCVPARGRCGLAGDPSTGGLRRYAQGIQNAVAISFFKSLAARH